MPAPQILIPLDVGQTEALQERAPLVNGGRSWWKVGILPPNGQFARAGLQAHWRLDGDGEDTSAYGRDLTTIQNLAYATSPLDGCGQCLSFADRAAVRFAKTAAIDASAWTAISIGIWVSKTAATGAVWPRALSFGAYHVAGLHFVCATGTDDLIISFQRAGTAEDVTIASFFSPLIRRLLLTFDLPTKAWAVYRNGVSVGSGTLVNPPIMPNAAFYLGNDSGETINSTWIGLEDEPAVWNRVLSPAEAAADFQNADGYQDWAAQLDNNQVSIAGRGSVFRPAEAVQATFKLRNSAQTFLEGDLANCPVRIRFATQNAGGLLDRGNCESVTRPMPAGETVPVADWNATFLRNAAAVYEGSYGFRYTKTVAVGTASVAHLFDSMATTDMHGFIPGRTYTLSTRLRLPIGGALGSEVGWDLAEYYGGAWHFVSKRAANTYDQWQTVTWIFTLNATDTGFYLYWTAVNTAALNEFFDVDNVSLFDLTDDTYSRRWLRPFTGFISPEGCQRTKTSLIEDMVELTAFDAIKRRGVNRKCANQAVLNYKVCDPGDTAHSLAHLLATRMGYAAADLDFDTISDVKDYIGFDDSKYTWGQLQDLAAQHGALLGVRYDGKLRLKVWTAAEWNAAVPEYTFDESNVRKGWRGSSSEVACNIAKTEYTAWQALAAGSIIYQNYDQWDATLQMNAIVLHAGEYWPVAAEATAVGRLEYGYGSERYPVGINIINPTLGAVGSGSDIESSGGVLTLISFNGSTADTQQNVDSSEIILKNNTGSDVTIRKFILRGTPLREIQKVRVRTVQATDGSIPDPEDEVEETIPGDFATGSDQAKITTLRRVDWGHLPRKVFDAPVDFTPHLQAGALVRFHPDAVTDVVCFLEEYSHRSGGPHTNDETRVRLVERVDFSAVGSGNIIARTPATPPGVVPPSSIDSPLIDIGAVAARELAAASNVYADDDPLVSGELFDFDSPDLSSSAGRAAQPSQNIVYRAPKIGTVAEPELRWAGRGMVGVFSAISNLVTYPENWTDYDSETMATNPVNEYVSALERTVTKLAFGAGNEEVDKLLAAGEAVTGDTFVFSATVYCTGSGSIFIWINDNVTWAEGWIEKVAVVAGINRIVCKRTFGASVSTNIRAALSNYDVSANGAAGGSGKGAAASGAFTFWVLDSQLEKAAFRSPYTPTSRVAGSVSFYRAWLQAGSFSGWVRPLFSYDTAAVKDFLDCRSAAANGVHLYYDSADDKIKVLLGGASTSIILASAAFDAAKLNQWIWVEVAWNVAAKQFALVVKNAAGTVDSTATDTTTTMGAITFNPVTQIGNAYSPVAGQEANAWFADMRISDSYDDTYTHFTLARPWYVPAELTNEYRSFRLLPAGGKLFNYPLALVDLFGRLNTVDAHGMRVMDASGRVQHDVQNGVIISNQKYLGHLSFLDNPTYFVGYSQLTGAGVKLIDITSLIGSSTNITGALLVLTFSSKTSGAISPIYARGLLYTTGAYNDPTSKTPLGRLGVDQYGTDVTVTAICPVFWVGGVCYLSLYWDHAESGEGSQDMVNIYLVGVMA